MVWRLRTIFWEEEEYEEEWQEEEVRGLRPQASKLLAANRAAGEVVRRLREEESPRGRSNAKGDGSHGTRSGTFGKRSGKFLSGVPDACALWKNRSGPTVCSLL